MLVIRPDEKLPVGRIEHDPEKLREVHAIGEAIAKREMDKIKDFLSLK